MKNRHSFGVIWAFGYVVDGRVLKSWDRKWKRHVARHLDRPWLGGDTYERWLEDVLCEWFIMKGMWCELKETIGNWNKR